MRVALRCMCRLTESLPRTFCVIFTGCGNRDSRHMLVKGKLSGRLQPSVEMWHARSTTLPDVNQGPGFFPRHCCLPRAHVSCRVNVARVLHACVPDAHTQRRYYRGRGTIPSSPTGKTSQLVWIAGFHSAAIPVHLSGTPLVL